MNNTAGITMCRFNGASLGSSGTVGCDVRALWYLHISRVSSRATPCKLWRPTMYREACQREKLHQRGNNTPHTHFHRRIASKICFCILAGSRFEILHGNDVVMKPIPFCATIFQATGLNVMDAREIQREGSRQFIQSSTDIEVMVEKRDQESRAASSTSASS